MLRILALLAVFLVPEVRHALGLQSQTVKSAPQLPDVSDSFNVVGSNKQCRQQCGF